MPTHKFKSIFLPVLSLVVPESTIYLICAEAHIHLCAKNSAQMTMLALILIFSGKYSTFYLYTQYRYSCFIAFFVLTTVGSLNKLKDIEKNSDIHMLHIVLNFRHKNNNYDHTSPNFYMKIFNNPAVRAFNSHS